MQKHIAREALRYAIERMTDPAVKMQLEWLEMIISNIDPPEWLRAVDAVSRALSQRGPHQ